MNVNQEMMEPKEYNIIDHFIFIKNELYMLYSLFKNNLRIIIYVSLFSGILGFIYAFQSKPIYNTNLSFLVGVNSGSSLSASISGLANSLGINGGSTLGSSIDRITELISSDRIISKALFNNAEIDEKNDLLINHFIEIEEIHKIWKKSEDIDISKIKFPKDINDISELSLEQRKIYKIIKEMIISKNGIDGVVSKYNDFTTGVVYIESKHFNESFAIEIVKSIYSELFDFYMNEANLNSQSKVDAITKKVDSISIELNKVQNMVAATSDQTLGLLLKENKVELKHLQVKEQMLTIMYGEALKNLEAFTILMETENPPITLVDYPFSPIKPLSKNKIVYFFVGFILSFFTLLFFYRIRLIYNKLVLEYYNS